MDFINLPLILVLLSIAGVLLVVIDFFFLKAKRKAANPNGEDPTWLKETKSFLPIVIVVLVLRSFIVEPFQIPSASMEPTLDVGDFILVNKFSYGLRLPVLRTKFIDVADPARGDVMVFFPPHDDRYFIKRVIGLPGDVIEYRQKALFINGEPQTLNAVAGAPMDFQQRDRFVEHLGDVSHSLFNQPRRPAQDFRYTVPADHYFMMGDNRDNSSDSRFWGPVPKERIVGKAFAIWMHWKDWSSLPSFSRVGRIQ